MVGSINDNLILVFSGEMLEITDVKRLSDVLHSQRVSVIPFMGFKLVFIQCQPWIKKPYGLSGGVFPT